MIPVPFARGMVRAAAAIAAVVLRGIGYLMCMVGGTSRGRTDSPPEEPARLTPEELEACLADAARINRYLWAGALCAGKRVLDAGCGLAQGSALLMQSGALEVVAVDSAAAIVDAARAEVPSGVRVEHTDILSLPFDHARFEVVVCFDVIEHSEEPHELLAALIRVLADDGILLLSCSGPEPANRPGRVAEVDAASGLEALLDKCFVTVATYHQADWLTTAVLDEQAVGARPEVRLGELTAYKVARGGPSAERSTIFLATNGPAPEPQRTAVLAQASGPEQWRELWDGREAIIAGQRRRIEELERGAGELSALRRRLLEAEEALSTQHVKQFDELREHIVKLEMEIESITGSRTWRMTAPLRLGGLVARRLRKV
jgi:hypothetical protein